MMKLTQAQQDAERRIAKARSVLVLNHPFFACIILGLKVEPIVSASWPAGMKETMATDGKRLIYGEAYCSALPERQMVGLLAHEVMHIAYLHHVRRQGREPMLWNLACDYAIDRDLKEFGFDVPDSLIDPRFNGMNAEQIYNILHKEGRKGSPSCAGMVLDADGGAGSLAEGAAQVLVRQAVMVSRARAGRVPGAIERMIADLDKPRISWRDALREFTDGHMRHDYCWSRPNRRHIHAGLILPGIVTDSPRHVVDVIDNSGSMDDEAVTACLSEAQAQLDEGACDKLTLLFCDTAINGVHEFVPGDRIDVKPRGGGGTRFSPAFDWIAENAPDCTAIVYLTDLGSYDFGEAPAVPVLWAVYGEPHMTAPFGRVLEVDLAS